jgi:hypothetical protein
MLLGRSQTWVPPSAGVEIGRGLLTILDRALRSKDRTGHRYVFVRPQTCPDRSLLRAQLAQSLQVVVRRCADETERDSNRSNAETRDGKRALRRIRGEPRRRRYRARVHAGNAPPTLYADRRAGVRSWCPLLRGAVATCARSFRARVRSSSRSRDRRATPLP